MPLKNTKSPRPRPSQNANSAPPRDPHFQPNYEACAVGPELHATLRALLDRARNELRPRNFLEEHLVDHLVIYKWRLLRVLAMESSIYEHEHATFKPPAHQDDPNLEPNADLYWLALCHTPERQGLVLAALARLEARYHRQFSSTLRLFLAVRRNPDATTDATNPATN